MGWGYAAVARAARRRWTPEQRLHRARLVLLVIVVGILFGYLASTRGASTSGGATSAGPTGVVVPAAGRSGVSARCGAILWCPLDAALLPSAG